MNRIKGLYRSWAIPCAGQKVYSPRYRSAWLQKVTQQGVRRRAEWLYQPLDDLQPLRREARREISRRAKTFFFGGVQQDIVQGGEFRVGKTTRLTGTPPLVSSRGPSTAHCVEAAAGNPADR
jgi:hypothetical protein